MTFISRYSAETLKNITFFEKFGKKKREIFFTFFSVFSGFFGEIFHPIFGRVHVVAKRFPEIDPGISGNSRGEISGNFRSFFCRFFGKKVRKFGGSTLRSKAET